MTSIRQLAGRSVMISAFIILVTAVLVPARLAFAQYGDPVMMQIDRDYESWVQYLKTQYRQGVITQSEYWRQTRTLEENIERRRAIRATELAEIQRKRELEERRVRAIEQIANQPPGIVLQPSPSYQPSRNINCTTTTYGHTARTSCY